MFLQMEDSIFKISLRSSIIWNGNIPGDHQYSDVPFHKRAQGSMVKSLDSALPGT